MRARMQTRTQAQAWAHTGKGAGSTREHRHTETGTGHRDIASTLRRRHTAQTDRGMDTRHKHRHRRTRTQAQTDTDTTPMEGLCLGQGPCNLLCIIPILMDDPLEDSIMLSQTPIPFGVLGSVMK